MCLFCDKNVSLDIACAGDIVWYYEPWYVHGYIGEYGAVWCDVLLRE